MGFSLVCGDFKIVCAGSLLFVGFKKVCGFFFCDGGFFVSGFFVFLWGFFRHFFFSFSSPDF